VHRATVELSVSTEGGVLCYDALGHTSTAAGVNEVTR
jgi:hypothetical protein